MARVRGTTTARGYGYSHQRARTQALAGLQDGTPCPRCGMAMYRTQQLDLDHDDDRQGYRGLAHARCNRQAGGKAKAMRYRKRKQQPTAQAQPAKRSRNW